MKKRILIALVMSLLVLSMAVPAYAAPPDTESWDAGGSHGGLVAYGYFINTTNLQVASFWLHNMSTDDRVLRVTQNGEVIFTMTAVAGTDYMEQNINGFKFRRMPATDPDDPNSIRYPPNTEISLSY